MKGNTKFKKNQSRGRSLLFSNCNSERTWHSSQDSSYFHIQSQSMTAYTNKDLLMHKDSTPKTFTFLILCFPFLHLLLHDCTYYIWMAILSNLFQENSPQTPADKHLCLWQGWKGRKTVRLLESLKPLALLMHWWWWIQLIPPHRQRCLMKIPLLWSQSIVKWVK